MSVKSWLYLSLLMLLLNNVAMARGGGGGGAHGGDIGNISIPEDVRPEDNRIENKQDVNDVTQPFLYPETEIYDPELDLCDPNNPQNDNCAIYDIEKNYEKEQSE